MKKDKQTYSCIDLSEGTIYIFDNYFDYRRFVKKGKLPKNWGKANKADMKGETSVCQNPKGNCFTCKLFEVCDAKTKPADMIGDNK